MKTRVVIVDDHLSLRQMLAVVLEREGVYEVTGEAGTGLEALRVCHRVTPEVVILDLVLPELCGVEVLRRLRSELPRVRVLIYSGMTNETRIVETLQLRPHGYVEKGDSLATFREGLRAVAAGRTFLSRFPSSLQNDLHGRPELTPREQEVLQLVAESRSSKEIAARLGLSVKTVENHRAHLMEKLHLHDVAALTRYALRTGLISVE